ncbi:hypothetical protein CD149_11010 [Staphylococcus condimenti]|uniref:Uncharacterized protein n=6 Tax=Staphylococcus condimenti TaxID=70255 RepID=A0AB37H439_9STAP|nr:hypothetical protein [Staphylococcus condimenti]AMY04960.1 hypothetical protein A4G25_03050 [Staphylococcus condimenti]MDK8645058.1 hypothetical protein [Staphylococcus condimenti]PNZ58102.1 hypothetical protein CD149_11010 [Staphylococcus condimenti]QQS83245.1 hypothetical protein I6J05_02670 [Staphylococcus condimenti]QRP96705.1 hypothetical protein I6J35_06355 [Staphylococcus condimenti]
MNKSNHFKSKSDLLNLIKQLDHKKSLHISENLSFKELFQQFIGLLNEHEKRIIEQTLLTNLPFVLIERPLFQQLTHLHETDYFIPLGKNRYFISPYFLNNYNHFILNDKFQRIPDLNNNIYKNIGYYALAETHRRKYETVTLADCLNHNFSDKELFFITKILKIETSKQISRKENCRLIAHEFLKDFYILEKLFEMIPSIKILFCLMVLEDRNSYLGATEENQSLATFMIFKNSMYEILYLPKDAFLHLKNYFNSKSINPATILESSIHNYSAEFMSAEEETKLLKALICDELRESDEDKLIEALCNDHLYYDLFNCKDDSEDQKFQFYDALLQLYGFVPLKIVKLLHNKYFDETKSIFEIKKEIKFFFKDIEYETLDEGYFVKPILQDAYSMLSEIYHDVPYYLPESLNELIVYNSKSSYINQLEIQDSINFLKKHLHIPHELEKNPTPLIKLLIIEELIIPCIKTLPFENDIQDTIKDWKIQGLFKNTSLQNLNKHALNLYRNLRLWTLRGHTISEYEHMRQTNPNPEKPTKIIEIDSFKK